MITLVPIPHYFHQAMAGTAGIPGPGQAAKVGLAGPAAERAATSAAAATPGSSGQHMAAQQGKESIKYGEFRSGGPKEQFR